VSTGLRDIGVDALFRLGGLRKKCSASLKCIAHGTPHPCELCEMYGLSEVVCEKCDHQFEKGPSPVTDRPCMSEAEHARTGRIAFEAEAIASFALEQEARARRERELAEQAEVEARMRLDEDRRRAAEPPTDLVPESESTTIPKKADLSLPLGLSLISTVVGGYFTWDVVATLVAPGQGFLWVLRYGFVLLCFAALILVAWVVSVLRAFEEGNRSLVKAVLVWPVISFVWPPLAAATIIATVGAWHLSGWMYFLAFFAGLLLSAAIIFISRELNSRTGIVGLFLFGALTLLVAVDLISREFKIPSAFAEYLASDHSAIADNTRKTISPMSQTKVDTTQNPKSFQNSESDFYIAKNSLYVGERKVFEGKDQGFIEIERVLPFRRGTVVLLAKSSGGTACPTTYYFVYVDNQSIIETEEFGTCSDLIEVSYEKYKEKQAQIIKVSMPTSSNETVIYVFDPLP